MNPLQIELLTRKTLLLPSTVRIEASIENAIGHTVISLYLFPEGGLCAITFRDMENLKNELYPNGCSLSVAPIDGLAGPGLFLQMIHIDSVEA